jgi:hypothetical protein
MNSLILLKERLQKTLISLAGTVDYREALLDATYACQFETATALEQWISNWLTTPGITHWDYFKGVQFVSDVWQEIKRNTQS